MSQSLPSAGTHPDPVGDASADTTRRIVEEINATHGLELSLHSRFSSGMQSGAWLLVGADGTRAVLKARPTGSAVDVQHLATIIERLRAAGYPTPRWLGAGATKGGDVYHVQELSVGVASTPLTPAKTALLLDVLEQHAGLDPDPARDRSREVAAAAVDESPGGFRHGVRQLGAVGRDLIDAYDDVMDAYGDVELPGGDLVHGDFNTCNILLDQGRVSAVIDIEELGSGTRVIDYACLLREAYVWPYDVEVKRMIRQAAEPIAGPGALAVCTAATAFFIIGFKVKHDPERVDSTLAGLFQLAADLSRPL